MIRNDTAIIQLLLKHTEEMSMQRIATLLKRDYKNTHNSIRRLEKEGILRMERFGQAYKITLIKRALPAIYEAEYNRRKETLKNKDIAVITDQFKRLNTKLYVLLLFGSHAKGTQTKGSDIDLLFIIPDGNNDIEKEIQQLTRLIPRNVHLTIITESEFRAMRDSKEFTVGKEAIQHHIILHGIEAYYELLT